MTGSSGSPGVDGGRDRYPEAPLFALDTLWFQVAGTLCNLECTHCFVSSSPTNRSHEMLDLATVERFLDEAAALGVREYYFTGGEPFMNPEMYDILEVTLRQGPASVLTNGLYLNPTSAARLRRLSDGSEYSLDIRVSIDGYDAESNDRIRGKGTFEKILRGIGALAEVGMSPVVTVTEVCEDAGSRRGRERFLEFLASIGLPHPRLKILPLLRLGAEVERSRAYASWETLRGRTLGEDEARTLACTSGRMVTSRGVYVCPILIETPGARLGDRLADGLVPFELGEPACFTCHVMGLSCNT